MCWCSLDVTMGRCGGLWEYANASHVVGGAVPVIQLAGGRHVCSRGDSSHCHGVVSGVRHCTVVRWGRCTVLRWPRQAVVYLYRVVSENGLVTTLEV